jgi:hypothetical protein
MKCRYVLFVVSLRSIQKGLWFLVISDWLFGWHNFIVKCFFILYM